MSTEHKTKMREAVRRGYQAGDVRVRRVIICAIVTMLSVPVIMLLLWVMFRSMADHRFAGGIQPRIAPQRAAAPSQFPEPRVMSERSGLLSTLRAKEDSELNSYGWVDQENGVVRIPIERAMDLLVQRGLPVRGSNVVSTGKSEYQLIEERRQDRTPEERK